MSDRHGHGERHLSDRAPWLRAAVLGANDGLLSTAALLMGVAAASVTRATLVTTGIAAIVAGALSMAVGEYSSVSSQRDTELADLDRERRELAANPAAEQSELAAIYRSRGLSAGLAERVAQELMAAPRERQLEVHARDELGLVLGALSRPMQAAAVSAASFTVGAMLPVLVVGILPTGARVVMLVVVTLAGLGALGAFAAHLGGARRLPAAVRVLVGGGLAMAVTAAVGRVVGAAV